jgi:predicted aspartyl protease
MMPVPTILMILFLYTPSSKLSMQTAREYCPLNEPETVNSADIPLQRVGNLLLIKGEADGVQGNFVLDTGAPGLVLNTVYFRDTRPAIGSEGGGITGLNIERRTKRVDTVKFGGLTYGDMYADVINLSHIENSKGVKILGLIGTAFFRNFEMILDIRKLNLQMYRIDRKGEYIKDKPDSIQFSLHQKAIYQNDVIVSYVRVGGKKVCFCIDTGAESNVLDNHNHRKILETISVTGRSLMRGAGNQRKEVLHGIMNDFVISGNNFKGMKVALTDLSLMRAAFGLNIKGMLGFDFLSRGIIRINLPKQMLSIAPYKTE